MLCVLTTLDDLSMMLFTTAFAALFFLIHLWLVFMVIDLLYVSGLWTLTRRRWVFVGVYGESCNSLSA